MACQVDDLIEEYMNYAFDLRYGYLTSCPTNTGTGLRASFMIHLPCLYAADSLKKLLLQLRKYGVVLRGIYGEGTAPVGGIYQISNQTTLGKSEEEIINALQNMTKTVLDYEAKAYEAKLTKDRELTEDRIYRAHAILANCRKISAQEAMECLAEVRFGYISQILNKPKPEKLIYHIMMEVRPGHIQRVFGNGKEMSENERDIKRATYLRETFDISG